MIGCPIAGPEGQDEILQARLEVLRARGLTPQLFLPAKKLDGRPTHSKHDRSPSAAAPFDKTPMHYHAQWLFAYGHIAT